MAKKKKPDVQQQLPGAEDPVIPEIDRAANRYVPVRDERAALSKKETEYRKDLEDVMRKHGLEYYRFDGKVIRVKIDKKAVVEPDPDAPAPAAKKK